MELADALELELAARGRLVLAGLRGARTDEESTCAVGRMHELNARTSLELGLLWICEELAREEILGTTIPRERET